MNTDESPREITQLLHDWSKGDETALNELMPIVYDQLHRMANQYMRSQPSGHTLQPTALIHEAYVKLAGSNQEWKNRAHFFGVASRAMRHILVDHVRNRRSLKRGSDPQRVPIEESILVSAERAEGLVELDETLKRLSALDERKGRVVELKYFGGLSNDEIAEVLSISPKTVTRDWQFARTWLLREMSTG